MRVERDIKTLQMGLSHHAFGGLFWSSPPIRPCARPAIHGWSRRYPLQPPGGREFLIR